MNNEINSKSIAGVKLIVVLGMILYHSGFNKIPGYGAFACVFFYMMSGFTTAFFRIDEWELSQTSIINYYKKKIDGICWIYYFTFFLMIPFTIKEIDSLDHLKEAICDGVMHLLFIQCWFPNITFKYNAVAWFSSALLFCYIFTPIMIVVIRRTKKWAIQVLLFTVVIHFFLEYCLINYPDVFEFSIHTNPFIKCSEYFMGMLLAIIYKNRSMIVKNVVFSSMIEVFSLCVLGGAIYLFTIIAYKSVVIIPMLIFVFCFSYGKGIVSKLFSFDFINLTKLQSEIYLVHYPVIIYFGYIIRRIGTGGKLFKLLDALLYVIITILVAYVVHYCLKMLRQKQGNRY
ncbi:MAG: acyltransferase [Butyrivibrio sp.]|nr:acyltransferase [Butyrivibrio sp.]